MRSGRKIVFAVALTASSFAEHLYEISFVGKVSGLASELFESDFDRFFNQTDGSFEGSLIVDVSSQLTSDGPRKKRGSGIIHSLSISGPGTPTYQSISSMPFGNVFLVDDGTNVDRVIFEIAPENVSFSGNTNGLPLTKLEFNLIHTDFNFLFDSLLPALDAVEDDALAINSLFFLHTPDNFGAPIQAVGRLSNIAVNPVPEPATALMVAVSSFALFNRRGRLAV